MLPFFAAFRFQVSWKNLGSLARSSYNGELYPYGSFCLVFSFQSNRLVNWNETAWKSLQFPAGNWLADRNKNKFFIR